MKIKNKYNIGDYVWIYKNNPTRHKIKGIDIFICSERGIRIAYVLEGTPPDICGFLETECFLSKNECAKNENYCTVKATGIRINKLFLRLSLIIAIMIISVPFSIAQAIHWLFTGRREPVTYSIMNKINLLFGYAKT